MCKQNRSLDFSDLSSIKIFAKSADEVYCNHLIVHINKLAEKLIINNLHWSFAEKYKLHVAAELCVSMY